MGLTIGVEIPQVVIVSLLRRLTPPPPPLDWKRCVNAGFTEC